MGYNVSRKWERDNVAMAYLTYRKMVNEGR